MRLGLSISLWSNLLYIGYPSEIWIHLTPSTRNSSLLKLSWNTMHLPTKVLLFGLIGDLFPLSPLPVPRTNLNLLLDPLPPVRHSDSLLVFKHLITLVQTPGFKVFPLLYLSALMAFQLTVPSTTDSWPDSTLLLLHLGLNCHLISYEVHVISFSIPHGVH